METECVFFFPVFFQYKLLTAHLKLNWALDSMKVVVKTNQRPDFDAGSVRVSAARKQTYNANDKA